MRNILALPLVFRLFNWCIGAALNRARLAGEFIKAKEGGRVLDIGCGIAEISKHLRHTRYYGFDISGAYIENDFLESLTGISFLSAQIYEVRC